MPTQTELLYLEIRHMIGSSCKPPSHLTLAGAKCILEILQSVPEDSPWPTFHDKAIAGLQALPCTERVNFLRDLAKYCPPDLRLGQHFVNLYWSKLDKEDDNISQYLYQLKDDEAKIAISEFLWH